MMNLKRSMHHLNCCALTGLAAALLFLGGCSQNESAEKESSIEVSTETDDSKPLTELQETILRSSGVSSRDIEEMKENGVPELTREFVETAETVLEKMQKRYDMSFMVCGGTIPNWSSEDYNFVLYATEGALAGREFDASYRLNDGQRCLYEEYCTLKRQTEVQEAVQKIADEFGTKIKIITYAEGELCEDVLPDSEEANRDIRLDVLGFMSKEIGDEEAEEAARNLYEKTLSYGPRDFNIFRVKDDSVLDMIVDFDSLLDAFPEGLPDSTECIW